MNASSSNALLAKQWATPNRLPILQDQLRTLRAIQAAGSMLPLMWNRCFLPHHFLHPGHHPWTPDNGTLPELHRWLDEHLYGLHRRRGSRLALIAPRESAKTTWITLAYVLRCAVEYREPYTLLFSDCEEQANKYLAAIKSEIEGESLPILTGSAARTERDDVSLRDLTLAAAYPEACGMGLEWRKDRIRLKNGAVVEALGRGSKVRGRKERQHRPSLIVIDDCQSNRDVASAAERATALNWFKNEVLPCGSEATNVISVGSALHRDAVAVVAQQMPGWTGATFAAIVRMPERLDLWDEWERRATNLADPCRVQSAAAFYVANRADMDRGGVSFWPAYKPLAALMMRCAEIGVRRFNTEYQGIPDSPEGRNGRRATSTARASGSPTGQPTSSGRSWPSTRARGAGTVRAITRPT